MKHSVQVLKGIDFHTKHFCGCSRSASSPSDHHFSLSTHETALLFSVTQQAHFSKGNNNTVKDDEEIVERQGHMLQCTSVQ